jgi:hypothetical protein
MAHEQTTMTVRLKVPVTASARDQQAMMWPQRPKGKLSSSNNMMQVRNQSTMTVRHQVAALEAFHILTRPMVVAHLLKTMTTASARGHFTQLQQRRPRGTLNYMKYLHIHLVRHTDCKTPGGCNVYFCKFLLLYILTQNFLSNFISFSAI